MVGSRLPRPRPATSRRSVLLGSLCLALAGGAGAFARPAFAAPPARDAASPRIASLNLLFTEILLTLQVRPVAVGNIPLYARLVAKPGVPAGTPDTGPLQEPNLELLQYLAPTHILAADWQASSLGMLDRVAPVTWLPTFTRDRSALDHVETLFRTIGALCGQDDPAETWIADARATLSRARDSIAPLADRPVYVVRFMADGRHAAVFGGDGMIGDVLRRLGLRNAWTGRTNAWGTTAVGIEQLATVPEARLIHFNRGAETARAMALLNASPLYNALPSVRRHQVIETPVVYPNGGLYSAMRLAGQLAEALSAANRSEPRHD